MIFLANVLRLNVCFSEDQTLAYIQKKVDQLTTSGSECLLFPYCDYNYLFKNYFVEGK